MSEEKVGAIKNVLQIMSSGEDVAVLTSFDGGEPGNEEEFKENYNKALSAVITATEKEYFEGKSVSYTPHIVFKIDEVPDTFKPFVEKDLKKFGENGERTMIVARYFENTEDGYIPVEVNDGYSNSIINRMINQTKPEDEPKN